MNNRQRLIGVVTSDKIVMMQNPRYAENFDKVLAIGRERNVAVQTIKGITRSPWKDVQQNRTTWYRPLEEQADIDLALHWILGNPQVFINTAGDINILRASWMPRIVFPPVLQTNRRRN